MFARTVRLREGGNSVDWEKAKRHLEAAIEAYSIIPTGRLALMITIYPLQDRYEAGERTYELYDAIMGISV
jgi:hypothetical protein